MKKVMVLILALAAGACSGRGRGDGAHRPGGPGPYGELASGLAAVRDRVANRKVAVLPFSYTDKRESDDGVVVSERLLTSLIMDGRLEVVERNLLEKVMGELRLQYSGAVDESSIKRLGKVLGVDAVVTGTLMRRPGGMLEINARVIGVENGVILAAAAVVAPADWETGDWAEEKAKEEGAAAPEPSPAAPQVEDFPAAWKYKENLRVSERSGASLVDYQMKVVFDSAELIRRGVMKPDCSDLRFTNSNEVSLLNYWLEKGCGGVETAAWVRLPFLAKNSVKNIYMYYGNPAASPASSGKAVFRIFDDFENGSIDAGLWTVIGGDCSVDVSGGRLRFMACGHGIAKSTSWVRLLEPLPPPFILDFDGLSDNKQVHRVATRWDGRVCDPYNMPHNALYTGFYYGDELAPSTTERTETCEARTLGRAAFRLTPGQAYSYSLAESGRGVAAWVDSRKLYSVEDRFSGGNYVGLGAREYPAGANTYYDNFRVRGFAEVEPGVYFHRKNMSAFRKALKGRGI